MVKQETGQVGFRQNKERKILPPIGVLISVTFYEPVFLAWLQEANIDLETLQVPF